MTTYEFISCIVIVFLMVAISWYGGYQHGFAVGRDSLVKEAQQRRDDEKV